MESDRPYGTQPPRDEAEAALWEQLGEALGPDFEVLGRLGEGAMASVYLARDRALGVFFAIKVLKPGPSAEETSRRRFEREAQSAASLSGHPNVVDVSRYGRLADETPFLVMRFVKGRTLEERLAAEGRLSVDEARSVLVDVASALQEAHAKDIVHRDVRPANILWDEEKERAMLTDFGIAAILATSGQEMERLTRTGQLVGDPRYMSPEQLEDEELTVMADVYALGILGYELLTAEGPYGAQSNTDWIRSHVEGVPRDLRELRPDADPELADLLVRCLARHPRRRPTAHDVVRRLRGEGGVAPVGGGALEAPPERDEWLRRRVPQIVGITFAGVMTVMTVVEFSADLLPEWARPLTLVSGVAALAASGVLAWFHGAVGKQHASGLEWVLLSVIGIVWAVASWLVVF